MKVKFYTFTKKYDSTAQPTGGTEYDCVLKTSSSVINPTIELQLGLASNPSAFNYCYIADYGRYYWLKEWTFSNHLWISEAVVDVLATWKTYIGSTSMYVYRSSVQSDGSIIDTKYPATNKVSFIRSDLTPVGKKFNEGYFVVGVFGKNNNNVSMSYYTFSATNFASFIQDVFNTGVLDNNIWGGLADGIRNSIYDISSYIKSVMWTPYDIKDPVHEGYNKIWVGGLEVPANCYRIATSASGYSAKLDQIVSIPKHPQARSRGRYLNSSPFSKYKLIYLPFGVIPLDGTTLNHFTHLRLTVEIDGMTCEAVLTVEGLISQGGGVYTNDTVICVRNGLFGANVPITVTSINALGSIGSLRGRVTQGMKGNIVGLIGNYISSVTELLVPDADQIGGKAGGIVGIDYDKNTLIGEFYEIVDEDASSIGRPLCQVKTPSSLGGYIVGDSHEFSAPATVTEMEEVKRFIDNGFYYE